MVRQAQPTTVLTHFQELASATKKLAETDIPRSVLPDLISLGDKMHGGATIRSLAFVPPVISTANPDYAKIRLLVQGALAPPEPKPSSQAAPAATTAAPPKPASTAPKASNSAAQASASSAPVDVGSACGLG
jgi:hypothetical protein